MSKEIKVYKNILDCEYEIVDTLPATCAKVVENENEIVVYRNFPEGGAGGIFQSIVGAALIAAGAILTIASAGTGSPLGAALIASGIGMIAGAVAQLFMPKPKVAAGGAIEQQKENSYNISGISNEVALGQCPPLLFGTFKVVGNIVGLPYKTVVNNEIFYNVLLCKGYKNTVCKNIRAEKTLLAKNQNSIIQGNIPLESNISGTIEVRNGSLPTIYNKATFENQYNAQLDDNFETTYVTSTSDTVKMLFIFGTNALYKINSNGSFANQSVTVRVRVRKQGATGWTQIIDRTFTNSKQNQMFWQVNYDLPEAGVYEVQARRTNKESDSSSVQDVIQLVSIAYVTNQFCCDATNLSMMALSVKSTDTLSGSLGKINAICTRTLTGMNNQQTQNSNVANCVWDCIFGIPKVKAVNASIFDTQRLTQLYNQQKNFNHCFYQSQPLLDLLNAICTPANSRCVLNFGKISFLIDTYNNSTLAIITPKNSTDFSASRKMGEVIGIIECTFADAASDYELITEDIQLENNTSQERKKVTLTGVTSWEEAVKLCRIMLASDLYRREMFSVQVGIALQHLRLGDKVKFSYDLIKTGIAQGRIESISGTTIAIDEVLTPTGTSYTLLFYTQAGQIITKTVTADAILYSSIVLDNVVGLSVGDIYVLGETGTESIECIIIDKEVNSDFQTTLSLTPYDAAVYDAATQEIPDYSPIIGGGSNLGADVVSPDKGISFTYPDYGQVFLLQDESTVDGSTIINSGSLGSLVECEINGNIIECTPSYNLFNFSTSFVCTLRNIDDDILCSNDFGGNIQFRVENADGKIVVAINDNIYSSNYLLQGNEVIAVVNDVVNFRLQIYINGNLDSEFITAQISDIFTDETGSNVLVDEAGSNALAVEVEGAKSLYDYDNTFQVSNNIAEPHIWEIAITQNNIWDVTLRGFISQSTSVGSNYRGEFLAPPSHIATLGDSFKFIGVSNNNFKNGSIYKLTLQGWILIG